MVDVAEWPKWLNDIVTRLDASSSAEGPSAVHGPASITPTLRKELRDICVELHHTHVERSALRKAVVVKDDALRLAHARLANVNARPLPETIAAVREALEL